MLTFNPKTTHARGVKVETADQVKELEAKHPGVAIGDYIVTYSSRPDVEVHEKGVQFENAWELASTDLAELTGRVAAIEESLKA